MDDARSYSFSSQKREKRVGGITCGIPIGKTSTYLWIVSITKEECRLGGMSDAISVIGESIFPPFCIYLPLLCVSGQVERDVAIVTMEWTLGSTNNGQVTNAPGAKNGWIHLLAPEKKRAEKNDFHRILSALSSGSDGAVVRDWDRLEWENPKVVLEMRTKNQQVDGRFMMMARSIPYFKLDTFHGYRSGTRFDMANRNRSTWALMKW